ncbi:MAG: folate-binding protein YgfZ [Alphaproteobacteria bacterium]|nr:folate-binding protein YgfZ [Alphaproteobacteria bacterium]
MTPYFTPLADRGVLEVAGADRVAFLQGLVSNDVAKAATGAPVHAALLTAQGKYLHDFLVIALGDALYLDCERARLADLQRRLALYKLRSKVTLADAGDRFTVTAAWGDDALAKLGLASGAAKPFAGGIAYADPRLATLGARMLIAASCESEIEALGFARADAADYDRHRLALGVPDGSRDLTIDKSILLENGFEELNGVDFRKGCYMGQELTARTKYRALIKKRLVPVTVDGPLPAPGTLITRGGEEAGEMRSGRDALGLALLRLDTLPGPFEAAGARLTPQPPMWMKLE